VLSSVTAGDKVWKNSQEQRLTGKSIRNEVLTFDGLEKNHDDELVFVITACGAAHSNRKQRIFGHPCKNLSPKFKLEVVRYRLRNYKRFTDTLNEGEGIVLLVGLCSQDNSCVAEVNIRIFYVQQTRNPERLDAEGVNRVKNEPRLMKSFLQNKCEECFA
jgi:hypothetical protein